MSAPGRLRQASDSRPPYAGRILRVDLDGGRTWSQPTAEYAERWLGGRAVNTWILLNELAPGTGWDEPANLLVFGAGLLVGTSAGGACRVSVESRNVFNEGIGSANMGGFWGAELKYAGFDHVVIRGQARRPVFLLIRDGQAQLREASSLWGLTTWDTEAAIRRELADERIRVLSIGPAGENRVRSACIIGDRACAAGGSGVGAVMGAKNLKAIAVRGTGGIGVAEPQAFLAAVDAEMARINRWEMIREIRAKGYYGAIGGREESKGWEEGYRPVRNGQDEYWDREKIARVAEGALAGYRTGTVACFSCPISCKPWMRIAGGPWAVEGEGWWNNSANAFCTKVDNTDLEIAIYAHHRVNQLGLDMDNAAQAVAWAFECWEKGLLTRADTGGLELRWGDGAAMLNLLENLARREGLGDLLAEGALRASQKLGRGSGEFVVHVKGQDSLDGVRINKGWGFGVAVSTVSGRHLRGSLMGFWLRGDRPITSYEKVPEDLLFSQKCKALQDILGLCSYVYGQSLEDWVDLFAAATGRHLSQEDLLLVGQRAHNLEKAFNTLHAGFTRQDDFPCRRYFTEPVASGPYAGERLDPAEWERMLDRLYELHGWDPKTGRQTRAGLASLGLDDVAAHLEKAGRLA